MKISETEIIAALITSIVAFIAAIVSGLFSYFSTKRSAKVDAMQAYLQFLRHKMDKLEEALQKTTSINSAGKDVIENASRTLRELYDYNSRILSYYRYLFSNNKSVNDLMQEAEKITLSLTYYQIKDYVESVNSPIYKEEDLPKKVSQFISGVKELIQNELKHTYDKFEELSMLK